MQLPSSLPAETQTCVPDFRDCTAANMVEAGDWKGSHEANTEGRTSAMSDNVAERVCELCEEVLRSEKEFSSHMRAHSDRAAYSTGQPLYSRKRCLSGDAATDLSKRRTESEECLVCHQQMYSGALAAHIQTVHPRLFCDECNVPLRNYAEFKSHVELVHSNFSAPTLPTPTLEISGSSDLRCGLCLATFPCVSALEIHMSSVHGETNPSKCKHCDKDLISKEEQMQHRCTMNGQDGILRLAKDNYPPVLDLRNEMGHPAIMPKIPFEFAAMKDFAEIRSLIPMSNRPSTLSDLKNSPNPGVTPASARLTSIDPDSPKSADSSSVSPNIPADTNDLSVNIPLSLGISTSGPITPSTTYSTDRKDEDDDVLSQDIREMKMKGEFPCRLCSMVLPNLRALKGHNRIHLTTAPYHCNMCAYSSNDKSTLLRHLRTHNGERPFECKLCQYAFTTKANCERHLRNRHGKNSRDEIRDSMVFHQQEVSIQEKVENVSTVCKICKVDFKHYRLLKEHQRTQHIDGVIRPYRCKICKIHFSTKNNVLRHSQKQHPQVGKDPTIVEENQGVSEQEDGTVTQHIAYEGVDTYVPSQMYMYPNSRSESGSEPLSQDNALDLSSSRNHSKEDEGEIEEEDEDEEEQMEPLDLSKDDPLDLSMKPKHEDSYEDEHMPQEPVIEKLPDQDPLPKNNVAFSSITPIFSPLYFSSPFQNQTPMYFHPFPSALSPYPSIESHVAEDMKSHYEKLAAGRLHRESPVIPQVQPFDMTTSSSSPSQHSPQLSSKNNSVSDSEQVVPSTTSLIDTPKLPQETTKEKQDETMVKMVIKNGVLMKKQKQRRYRTERPFSCDHCSARFTLRSNMERHIKQQHPQYWSQRPRVGRGRLSMPNIHVTQQMTPPACDETQSLNGDISSLPVPILQQNQENELIEKKVISEEVKQQLKSKLQMAESQCNMDYETDEDDGLVIDEEQAEKEGIRMKVKKEAEEEFEGKREEESNGDLVSISKLLDTAKTQTFDHFFKSNEEEEENSTSSQQPSANSNDTGNSSSEESTKTHNDVEKKKSAYSSAPHKVACPFCSRKFPWTSSLKRHILTHTGHKPYKCPQCPLWFTTKSNCDRHLLRKHGNDTDGHYAMRNVPERPYKCNRCPSSTFSTQSNLRKHQHSKHNENEECVDGCSLEDEEPQMVDVEERVSLDSSLTCRKCSHSFSSPELLNSHLESHSELPFKCHLCDDSYSERKEALEHIKATHPADYDLLISKGALENPEETRTEQSPVADDTFDSLRGKFPDYINRKVSCAFCLRRFWSAEDLRRHMRTHTGERPFACDICNRKFTLKHSMLRHRKKHSNPDCGESSEGSEGRASPDSTAEHPPVGTPVAMSAPIALMTPPITPSETVSTMIKKENLMQKITQLSEARWKSFPTPPKDEVRRDEEGDLGSDLIGNLLGINDKTVMEQIFTSANDAAKLLGVPAKEG